MAESVDAPDLKSVDHCGRGSSSLPTRTAINIFKAQGNSDEIPNRNRICLV